MRNVVCWEPRQVHAIINTSAESVSDVVFRAVHSDQILRVAQPVGDRFQMLSDSAFQPIAGQDLLQEFLRGDRRHVQLAVFGRSGSGKSHLIHWMRLNIPQAKHRLVLTIPKAGTSLRSIVETIIDHVPAEAQPPFRDALQRAGDSVMTRDGQKHELLNQIAQSLREAVNPQRDEMEEALTAHLPDLFQDAYLRNEYFFEKGRIVDELVDHVFAVKNVYDPADDRHQFSPRDFPAGGLEFTNASKPARAAINTLMLDYDRTLPMAAKIVNRILDDAISRALSFSGDRITALMGELRKYLRRQGSELVLLIEDIARLQGIDRALLQALLTQGDEQYCNIRWAIAATTGFFETIADTVYTRMTFLIDMDRSAASKSGKMTRSDLANFAGRYLNAVRLGAAELENWGTNAHAGDSVENKCTTCQYRGPCHATFKSSDDGFGLYPFTERALWNMARRVDHEMEEKFNPRVLQTNVLLRVLDTHARELELGAFPSRAILEEMGGIRGLGASELQRLSEGVPAAQFDRTVAMHELYDGSSTLRDLPAELLEAFGLSKFSSTVELAAPDRPVEQEPPKSPAVDQRIGALDSWANGGVLEQAKTPRLREIVYSAIEEAIDWDAAGFERAAFAGASANRPFRQRSIYFQKQDTQRMSAQIQLIIPPEGSDETAFRQTALALQGLTLAAERGGEWTFPNGFMMLLALQECLASWTSKVVEQVRALPGSSDHWDPVAGAVEVLGVGACLAGKIRADSDPPEMVNAVLGDWTDDPGLQSTQLKKIYLTVRADRQEIIDFLRSVRSGTKGGQTGDFLDPAAVLPTLEALRQSGWRLAQVPPQESASGPWSKVAKVYRAISGLLAAAAQVERDLRLLWLNEMETAFGHDVQMTAVIDQLSLVRDAAVTAGLGGAKTQALGARLEEMRATQYDDAITATASLRAAVDPLAVLPSYGWGSAAAVEASRALANAAREFLARMSNELTNLEDELDGAGRSVAGNLERIRVSLGTIAAIDATASA